MPYDPIFPSSGGSYTPIFPEEDEGIITPEERLRRMRERFPGAPSGLNDDGPDTSQGFWSAATDRALAAWKSGYTGLADLATRSRMMPTSGPLKGAAERAEEGRRREMDEFAEASTRAGLPPVATALTDTALEAVDPLDLVGGLGVGAKVVTRGARALRRGGRAASAVPPPDDLADLARRSLEIGEEPGSALRRDRALDRELEEAGETGLRGSETPIGREGKLRPPDEPFQYNAASLDVPETALPEIRDTMRSEKVLTRRRTGREPLDYDVTEKLRRELGMDEKDFTQAPIGKVWNEEEQVLLRAYLGKWGRRVEELRPAMREDMAKGLESSPAIDAFADARVKWIDLLAADMAGGTEMGRAFRARQQLVTAIDSPESLRAYLGRKLGDKLDPEDVDLLTKTDLSNPEELVGLIRRVNQPKWWEHPTQVFVNNIFSSSGSFGRDVVGNGLKLASQVPVRIGGAIIDAPLAKLQGRARRQYIEETLPQIWGMLEGFPDGLRRMWETLSRGWFIDPLMEQAEAIAKNPSLAAKILEGDASEVRKIMRGGGGVLPRSKVSERGLPPLRRAKSALVRRWVAPWFEVGFRGHGAIDQLGKGVNEGSELRVLAYRNARERVRKEGLGNDEVPRLVSEFMEDPPPEAIEQIAAYGERQTFQTDLGPAGQAVHNLSNKVPGMKFLIPVVRTAGNIFKESAKFTPFNAPRSVRMALRDHPDAADEMAKVAIGSSLIAWGWTKAMAGEIVGMPPKEQGERDAFYQQKKKPFSVRVGDQWYQFSQMEPFGMPLSIVASAWEGFRQAEPDATTFERMQRAMALTIASQIDKSYFTGLADLASLREAREGAGTAFMGRQLAATAIPNYGAVRSLTNYLDTRVVEREGILDYLKEAIPGQKEKLPGRLTRFGEEIHRTKAEAIGPTGTAFVPSRVTDDEVELALEELGLRVGFPGRSIEGVELNRDEYRAYLERVGPKTKEMLASLLQDPSFREMPQDYQQRTVDRWVQASRDPVRLEASLGLIPGIPPLMVKKQLAANVDAFNSERSRVDGISSRYNERTRNRGQTSVEEMFEAGEEADEAWSVAYGGLQQAVTDARRQGLTDEQIVGLLRKKGLSHRVARAVVGGATMSFQDYRDRRGDFD